MLWHTAGYPHLIRFFLLLTLVHSSASIVWGQGIARAQDEAYFDAYSNGWETGTNGGFGFQNWRLFRPDFPEEEGVLRFAGFFLAQEEVEGNLGLTARNDRAFGIFANGTGFEETLAYRRFWEALRPREVFSWKMTFEGFQSKFDEDAEGLKSVGLILRGSSTVETMEDINNDRRLVIAAVEGFSTYQVYDLNGRFNTGVFLDPKGALFVVKIGLDNTYQLEIQTLSDGRVQRFENRFLDEGEGPLHGFALFNRNAGLNNVYFGAFQIDRPFRQLAYQ